MPGSTSSQGHPVAVEEVACAACGETVLKEIDVRANNAQRSEAERAGYKAPVRVWAETTPKPCPSPLNGAGHNALGQKGQELRRCPNGHAVQRSFTFCPGCGAPIKPWVANQYQRTSGPGAVYHSSPWVTAERWNGLAIASFVLGIVPVIPVVGSIVAIVLAQ